MNSKIITFMNKNLNSKNIDNDQFPFNKEENEYKNLITRLKEISEKISLIEKSISR